MSRTYPLIIVLAAALVAAVGCGDDAPDVLEPHTEAGTEALRVKVPIDVRFFVDDAIDVTPDGVTLDNVIDPREAALEVRDYDVFDVSGVEFTEGGWGLSRVCETAFLSRDVDVVPLLDLFLSLDQPGEGRKAEQALIGVRKAQSILGAFFLEHEAEPLAQRIRHDMSHESNQRLLRIRDGILTVSDQKFWEITDRGINFDYVPPERHLYIRAFFEPMLRDGRRDR